MNLLLISAVTVMLIFSNHTFAGVLDSCGVLEAKGQLIKSKDNSILRVYPGRISSIDLVIFQELDYDLNKLPINLELFNTSIVIVTGKIKKLIKQ